MRIRLLALGVAVPVAAAIAFAVAGSNGTASPGRPEIAYTPEKVTAHGVPFHAKQLQCPTPFTMDGAADRSGGVKEIKTPKELTDAFVAEMLPGKFRDGAEASVAYREVTASGRDKQLHIKITSKGKAVGFLILQDHGDGLAYAYDYVCA